MYKDIAPFEDQTPKAILSREYAAGTFAFTHSSSHTHLIDAPQFSDLAFLRAIESFRFFRCMLIKWRIQVVAVPQVYGAVMMTCIPADQRRFYTTGDSYSLIYDYGWASHTDVVWCDMSTMNDGQITVPWLSYNQWMDLRDQFTDHRVAFNYLSSLKVMCPNWVFSVDSSIPRSCQVMVWCQFVNPEVAGPIQPESTEAQMQSGNAFWDAAVNEGKRYLANEGLGHFKNAVKAGFNVVDDWAGDWFDFDDPEERPVGTQSSAAAVSGADQATSVSVVPNVYGDTNLSKPKNCLGPAIGSPGITKHDIYEYMRNPTLYSYKVDTDGSAITLPTSPLNYEVNVPNAVDEIRWRCCRMEFVSRFFRMWRGSFVYTLMFFSSPFIVHKYIVKLHYTTTDGDVGNIITKVITVKGTTVERIEIPYLSSLPWQFTTSTPMGELEFPTLTIKRYVATQVAGDSTASCLILVYKHAGDDFRLISPCSPHNLPPLTESVQMQASIREFKYMRSTPVAGTSTVGPPSGPCYFEDLAKRWSSREDFSFDAFSYLGDLQQPWEWTISDCVRSIFLYNRGSHKVRIKFDPDQLPPEVNDQTMICVIIGDIWPQDAKETINPWFRWGNGSHVISYGLTQVIEFTVPYINIAEWVEVWKANCSVGKRGTLISAFLWFPEFATSFPITFSMFAMCDDFALSYPMPPPKETSRWYNRHYAPGLLAAEKTQAGEFSIIGEPKRTAKDSRMNLRRGVDQKQPIAQRVRFQSNSPQ